MQATRLDDSSSARPSISIVLPTYNEVDRIESSVQATRRVLAETGLSYEIVVVDDGSTDGTLERARRCVDGPVVRVLGYPINKGKGFALCWGMSQSHGDVIAFIDSDLEVSPTLLKDYVRALAHADLVIGSKRHPGSKVRVPTTRRFLSFGFQQVVRLLTGLKVKDTQTGMKAGRANALKRALPLLSVKRYAFDVELLVVAQLLGMKVVEMPVEITLGARFSARAIIRMFVDVLGISYRLRVKRWYQMNLNNPSPKYRPLVRW